MSYTEQQILDIGGARDGLRRVQLHRTVWAQLLRLEVERDVAGRIVGGTIVGMRLTAGDAQEIIGVVQAVYWDAADGEIHVQVGSGRYAAQIPGWIRKAVAHAVARRAEGARAEMALSA